ncbi:unnamed protein product, partial [Iphiclides podalirius]
MLHFNDTNHSYATRSDAKSSSPATRRSIDGVGYVVSFPRRNCCSVQLFRCLNCRHQRARYQRNARLTLCRSSEESSQSRALRTTPGYLSEYIDGSVPYMWSDVERNEQCRQRSISVSGSGRAFEALINQRSVLGGVLV